MPFTCDVCGWVALRMKITEYDDSQQHDFHGSVDGECAQFGSSWQLFEVASSRCVDGEWQNNRQIAKVEHPVCHCGGEAFYTAIYNLYESDFFDEGVLVGKCAKCGKNKVFVRLD